MLGLPRESKKGGNKMKVSEIRKWKKNEGGYYVNPKNGNWVSLGDRVRLGDGVRLGDWVSLGDRVRLGDEVSISDRFLTITDRYTCHIYPKDTGVQIRLGCEIHSIDTWNKDQWDIADKYKSSDNNWYEKTGQYILQVLIGEAERYKKEGTNNDKS